MRAMKAVRRSPLEHADAGTGFRRRKRTRNESSAHISSMNDLSNTYVFAALKAQRGSIAGQITD